jgi:hypothetical protein
MKISSSYQTFADYTKALCALIRDKKVAWIETQKPRTFYNITAYFFD